MTIYLDLNIEFDKMKPERQEIYNFKESEGQHKFKIATTLFNTLHLIIARLFYQNLFICVEIIYVTEDIIFVAQSILNNNKLG